MELSACMLIKLSTDRLIWIGMTIYLIIYGQISVTKTLNHSYLVVKKLNNLVNTLICIDYKSQHQRPSSNALIGILLGSATLNMIQ
jgi:hypothetical protein